MKTKMMILALASLAVVSCSDKKSKTDPDMMTMSVDVAYPTTDSVTIRKAFPAYLESSVTVDIVARVDGYVTAKHYKDGDRVKKGQVLFSIEDTQYRNAVAQAEAALATAKSQTDYATRQYEAMKRALASDAVSEMDVIQAESNMNEGRASIKNAEAALQTARTNLGYCTVRALADGHITAASVDVGDYVSGAGSPATLATIYDDAALRAVLSIDDSRYIGMSESDAAKALDSIPLEFSTSLAHNYLGRLEYVSPEIDMKTGTMTLRVNVDNKYGELKDGMYTQVMLPLGVEPHAIIIDDAAISTDQRGKYIYTVNDSDRVVYTPIEVGQLYLDTLRIVTSGLKPSDRYVTKALLKVRDGMKVKPIQPKK